jgi:hypothetical protein
MDWKDKITEEKSLFAVYRKARGIALSRINKQVALAAGIISVLLFGANIYFNLAIAPYAALITTIREIGEAGFSFSTGILGFLIAGFSIFASITKPEVFILLAKLPHKQGNITRLQFIFFNFLVVFVHYIFFLAVCLFIKVGLYDNGPLSGILRILAEEDRRFIVFGATGVLCLLITWLTFLVMLLKSFIWNIYQSVLLSIVTEGQRREAEEADGNKKCCCKCGDSTDE